MTHERFHELIVLDIYGQLDHGEERELVAHLSQCVECRRLQEEAEADLGVLARQERESRAFDQELRLSADQVEAIRRSRPEREPAWRRHRNLIIGFAAGLLLAPLAQRWLDPGPARPGQQEEKLVESFGRDTFPPPATASGFLVALGGTRPR